MKLKKTFIAGIILVLLNCSGCTGIILYLGEKASYRPATPYHQAREIGILLGRTIVDSFSNSNDDLDSFY